MVAMLTGKALATPNARCLACRGTLASFSSWNQILAKLENFLGQHPRLMWAHSFIDLYFFDLPSTFNCQDFWVVREFVGHLEAKDDEIKVLDLVAGEVFSFPLDLGEFGARTFEQTLVAAQQFELEAGPSIAPTWRIRVALDSDFVLSVRIEFFKMISIS